MLGQFAVLEGKQPGMPLPVPVAVALWAQVSPEVDQRLSTNLAALALFAGTGNIMWTYGVPLAVANIGGSIVGTGIALRNGAPLVRKVFVVVVAALIAKTALDAW